MLYRSPPICSNWPSLLPTSFLIQHFSTVFIYCLQQRSFKAWWVLAFAEYRSSWFAIVLLKQQRILPSGNDVSLQSMTSEPNGTQYSGSWNISDLWLFWSNQVNVAANTHIRHDILTKIQNIAVLLHVFILSSGLLSMFIARCILLLLSGFLVNHHDDIDSTFIQTKKGKHFIHYMH